nr:MAG TPA: hypothetical protein [Caudoviricetes sp.]
MTLTGGHMRAFTLSISDKKGKVTLWKTLQH